MIRENDDYFVKLGSTVPPSLSEEGIEQIDKIEAKPLFVFVMTKSNMEEFIKLVAE